MIGDGKLTDEEGKEFCKMGYKWPMLIKVDFYPTPKHLENIVSKEDADDDAIADAIDQGADPSETELNCILGIGQKDKQEEGDADDKNV